jgi:hypothetical protein
MSVLSSLKYSRPSGSLTHLWLAFGFMPFGLFFDFFDGKVARWRKKSSLMGQELDSLADLVRPGQMIYCLKLTSYRSLSVWLLHQWASPLGSTPSSTSWYSLSTFCVVSLASPDSTLPCRCYLRIRLANQSISRERQCPSLA